MSQIQQCWNIPLQHILCTVWDYVDIIFMDFSHKKETIYFLHLKKNHFIYFYFI